MYCEGRLPLVILVPHGGNKGTSDGCTTWAGQANARAERCMRLRCAASSWPRSADDVVAGQCIVGYAERSGTPMSSLRASKLRPGLCGARS